MAAASTAGKMLIGVRAGIGVGAWVAPNLSGKAFGLDPTANPQASFVGRLFAIRDLALAAGTNSSTGEARKLWWRLGMLCDAADAAAALLAGRRGVLNKPATVLSAGTALLALGMGAAALSADDV